MFAVFGAKRVHFLQILKDLRILPCSISGLVLVLVLVSEIISAHCIIYSDSPQGLPQEFPIPLPAFLHHISVVPMFVAAVAAVVVVVWIRKPHYFNHPKTKEGQATCNGTYTQLRRNTEKVIEEGRNEPPENKVCVIRPNFCLHSWLLFPAS